MKTAYASDNTRSSIVIVLALAVAVGLVAALIGLSEKPDVQSIAISPNTVDAAPAAAPANASAENFGFDVGPDAPPLDDQAAGAQSDAASAESAAAPEPAVGFGDDNGETADGDAIVVPTSEPTATPEVAAAVEPTPIPDQSGQSADNSTGVQAAPSLPSSSGSVQGTFFTKGDENEGAVVAQNLITVSFAEDGSGAFQGVLDITYADGTHILLNMSGPLTWAPSNPQVEATLAGAFTLDAPIDADDIVAEDAELSISSLEAGSGSLCTTKCFGFTFPPQ